METDREGTLLGSDDADFEPETDDEGRTLFLKGLGRHDSADTEAEGGDVYRLVSDYRKAIASGSQDDFWQSLDDQERAAIEAEGEASPYRWNPDDFTPPTPDKPDYDPARLSRALREAKLGLDSIRRGQLVVDEETREAAFDLNELAEATTGQPRNEAILALEDLVNKARLHAASVGAAFDDDHVVSRRTWIDAGGRRHEEEIDNRGHKRDVVLTRRETQEAIRQGREARTLGVSPDSSPGFAEALQRFEAGKLTVEEYLGLSQADRVVVMQKMTADQRERLRYAVESLAENEGRGRTGQVTV